MATTITTQSPYVEALVAGISAVAGGMLMKFLDRRLNKADKDAEESVISANAIRKELWNEIHLLKVELDTVRDEVDSWREKYYQLVAENLDLERRVTDLNAQVAVMTNQLKSQAQDLD